MINIKRLAEEAAVQDPRAYAADCVDKAQEFKEKIPLKLKRDAELLANTGKDGTVEIDMEDLKRTMQEQTRPVAYDAPHESGKPIYETQLKPAKATSNTATITNDTVDEDVKRRIEEELEDEGR